MVQEAKTERKTNKQKKQSQQIQVNKNRYSIEGVTFIVQIFFSYFYSLDYSLDIVHESVSSPEDYSQKIRPKQEVLAFVNKKYLL